MDIPLEGLTNIHSESASPSMVDLPHSGSSLALSMEHGDRTLYHILFYQWTWGFCASGFIIIDYDTYLMCDPGARCLMSLE